MSGERLDILKTEVTEKRESYPSIAHVHATTWHDGGAAFLTQSGKIYAISAERVGDRFKHSWDSALAHQHLKESLSEEIGGEIDQDNLVPVLETGLETTGHHYHYAEGFCLLNLRSLRLTGL